MLGLWIQGPGGMQGRAATARTLRELAAAATSKSRALCSGCNWTHCIVHGRHAVPELMHHMQHTISTTSEYAQETPTATSWQVRCCAAAESRQGRVALREPPSCRRTLLRA